MVGWLAGDRSLCPQAPACPEAPSSLTVRSTSLPSLSPLTEELSNVRWKKPKGMKVTALYSLLRAF